MSLIPLHRHQYTADDPFHFGQVGLSLAPVASSARLNGDIQLGGNFLQLFDEFLVLHFVARMTNYPAAQF